MSDAKTTSIRRLTVIVLVAVGAWLVHAVAPAGPHSWHWLHLVAEKLYILPILLAAAWFDKRMTIGVATTITVLFLIHIAWQWSGDPMRQADQLSETVTFWLVAMLSSFLWERQRAAFKEVRNAHDETLAALARSLEMREAYTARHSERVRAYTLLLADQMRLADHIDRSNLAMGALLHDIGKVGIPDRLLLKEGELTAPEREEIRRHPELGASLIGRIGFLQGARELVVAHHERFDGKGYPRGLSGLQIPLGARLFAVADAFDAMTTDRPYRAASSYDEAAASIAEERGGQFDPDVVQAFLQIPCETWTRVAAEGGITLTRRAQGP